MNKKIVKDIDVKGKVVFCCVDFNVLMKDGEVIDDICICAVFLIIKYFVD